MWTEPEELVAARISGSCNDGANDNENMVDGYVPLRKLYDWENKRLLDSMYEVRIWVDINKCWEIWHKQVRNSTTKSPIISHNNKFITSQKEKETCMA